MSPDATDIIMQQLKVITERLDRIERHLERLNGDVTDIKLWRARAEGALSTIKWLPAALIAVGASACGVMIGFVVH